MLRLASIELHVLLSSIVEEKGDISFRGFLEPTQFYSALDEFLKRVSPINIACLESTCLHLLETKA